MFFFLFVSIRCLTKGKLKKRKHRKYIFLKQCISNPRFFCSWWVAKANSNKYHDKVTLTRDRLPCAHPTPPSQSVHHQHHFCPHYHRFCGCICGCICIFLNVCILTDLSIAIYNSRSTFKNKIDDKKSICSSAFAGHTVRHSTQNTKIQIWETFYINSKRCQEIGSIFKFSGITSPATVVGYLLIADWPEVEKIFSFAWILTDFFRGLTDLPEV